MQSGQVGVYASLQLKIQEDNYPTHDLELSAIIFTLKVWRHHMYGMHFAMFFDHKSLMYLFDQKELNICQRRLMDFLKDYYFELKYHFGKGNKVAHVLSIK